MFNPKKLFSILLSAMFLVSFLAGCVTTENNGDEKDTGITPLTAEEMDFFNGDEFFNGSIIEMGHINICNQFLNSLYDTPEEIDLFELFYCGSGLEETVTEEERTAVIEYNEWDAEPDCACEKISRVNMDAVLTEYMGLTLADTNELGLEKFTYLEEYDAYYHFHGDTNYRGMITTFTTGEREGNLIRLFYYDDYMTQVNKVLTLCDQDGSYLFVSNQVTENSVLDTNDNEFARIIPLTIEEVEYFNGDQFFNGEHLNIRNQFLCSLYDSPERIDLCQLFYNGSGFKETVTDEEKDALVELGVWWEVDCEKNSRANMDAVLTEHMGLTLANTDGVGLEYFSYLEEYDAYYFFHGDTNYRISTTFSGGEREGDLIRLFYNDLEEWYGGDKVLTLREQDGSYLFVSNQMANNPALSTNEMAEYDHSAVEESEYTYPGVHAVFTVILSNDAKFEVILSKPIRQSDDGIWCVERMYDGHGNIYVSMPETDLTAMEYYTQLQAEVDEGHRPGLLDAEDVALTYLDSVWDYARHIKDSSIEYPD